MKVVVITGSRYWSKRGPVEKACHEADIVIHGGAPGADDIADDVEGCLVIPVQAYWGKHGRSAGPRRNRRMAALAKLFADMGHEVQCHAFPLPGSNGTYDCIHALNQIGLEVTIHEADDA